MLNKILTLHDCFKIVITCCRCICIFKRQLQRKAAFLKMCTAQFSITAVFPRGNYPFIIDGIGHLEMQLETDKRVFLGRQPSRGRQPCRNKTLRGCRKN